MQLGAKDRTEPRFFLINTTLVAAPLDEQKTRNREASEIFHYSSLYQKHCYIKVKKEKY